jgi:lipoyl-dependent peroxiredoxin
MSKVIYTAEAHVDGGRMHGHGRTSDGVLEVDIRPPGGEEQGVNPEQLFAIGYAACFESALSVVARRKKLEIGEVAIDSAVDLRTTDDRGFELAVRMDITLPGVDDADEATDLITTAHRVCPYSRATRGNIDVDFTVNGAPVREPAAT